MVVDRAIFFTGFKQHDMDLNFFVRAFLTMGVLLSKLESHRNIYFVPSGAEQLLLNMWAISSPMFL